VLRKRQAAAIATPEDLLELNRLERKAQAVAAGSTGGSHPSQVSRANTWSKAIREHRDGAGEAGAINKPVSEVQQPPKGRGHPPKNPSSSSSSLGGSSRSGGAAPGGRPAAVSMQSSGHSLSSGVPGGMRDGISLPRPSISGRDAVGAPSPVHEGMLPIDADSSRSLVHGFSGRSMIGRSKSSGGAASVSSSGFGEVLDAEGNTMLVMLPGPAAKMLGGSAASHSRLDTDARSFRSRSRVGQHRSGGSRGSSARSLLSRSSRGMSSR